MDEWYTKTALDVYLQLIERLARAMECELGAGIASRLAAYLEQVAAWDLRAGLTGARTAEARVELLLADALVISRAQLVPRGSRLLDVGSGAGAPAMPLLLMRDDLSALLLEPKRKRAAFLRTAAEKLDLGGRAQVLEQRLDPLRPLLADHACDVAMSRATFPADRWVEAGVRLAPRTLVFTAREPPPAAPAGSERATSLDYRLPGSGAPRRVTVYSRV
jgi:16S rRNA (guanine527-N7)-methyltransferase